MTDKNSQTEEWKENVIRYLNKNQDVAVTQVLSEFDIDQSALNRLILELEERDHIRTSTKKVEEYSLTDKGVEVAENGSPEYRLLESVEDGEKISELSKRFNSVDVGLGKAREKNWIKIDSGSVEKLVEPDDVEDEVRDMALSDNKDSSALIDRGLVKKQVNTVKTVVESDIPDEFLTESSDFNVEADVKTPRTGKKHFYYDIMSKARRKWLEMGFQEMTGGFVVSSLINFDALFTPQDHPAREMHDTFFVKNPNQSKLEKDDDLIENIRKTHEDGGDTSSRGYEYSWNIEEAKKNVLRTHTTAVSAQKLAELEEDQLPKKYFTISRAFRNETVDDTHLPEFYQTDGIVVSKDVNFRNLKGYLREYFEKMGFENIRIIPTYYPYTEMSAEVQVYDENSEEWMGLGGSGMFREEVVKPLLGFEAQVLAWGLGIGRIAMKSAQIEDIRKLYDNEIERISNTPYWRQ